jgi:ubiquinone/menaquinone biosynthesis C-methylase UbiE
MTGVIEGYDCWASTYDRDPNPLIALEERGMLEVIGRVAGQRVLDLGCGTGRYGALLSARGAMVVGVDRSLKMLEQARHKISCSRWFALSYGPVDRLAFADERFDLVLSALTLGHLPDLECTFREAVRVLQAGGQMALSDIHPYWPVSGHDYTELFDRAGREYRIPVYPHLFEEVWRLCTGLGLHLEEVREPRIDDRLIELFPALEGYLGIPLAIVLKFRKPTSSPGRQR